MLVKILEQLRAAGKALSVGGAVILDMANPVNLAFFALIVMAFFALFNEQIILVGMISTLSLLTGAVAAGLLAAILSGTGKTLSPGGFKLFLALAFAIPLVLWSFEIFNTIAENQWLHVAGLAAIMLLFSLYPVPRSRRLFQSKGIMA